MTIEEFETKIANNAHKSEIIRLVKESLNIFKYEGEKAEKWLDSCYELYETSLCEFTHFKLNMANRIDTAKRYQQHIQDFEQTNENKLTATFHKVITVVESYANNRSYANPELLADIEKAIFDYYEQPLLYLSNRVDELNDRINFIQLLNDDSIDKIKFESPNNSYSFNSKKLMNVFKRSFVDYFRNSYITEPIKPDDIDKLEKEKKICVGSQKKLIHRVVYEIYRIFASHKILDFTNEKDNYLFQISNNDKYPSLKGDVSAWIFDLLELMGYLDYLKERKNYSPRMLKKEKIDFIKDCMKDTDYHSWKEPNMPKDWFYF